MNDEEITPEKSELQILGVDSEDTEPGGDEIDFCRLCGSWVSASSGRMQLDENGKVVILCNVCEKAEGDKNGR